MAKRRTVWVALYARGHSILDVNWTRGAVVDDVAHRFPRGIDGVTYSQFRELPLRRGAKAKRARRKK